MIEQRKRQKTGVCCAGYNSCVSAKKGCWITLSEWKYSKENNCSFFVLSLGCLMKAVNSIPQLKRRIVNNKVIEHDYLDGVCPIMDENNETYKEMRVKPPEIFNDFEKWHDFINVKRRARSLWIIISVNGAAPPSTFEVPSSWSHKSSNKLLEVNHQQENLYSYLDEITKTSYVGL